jgi:hypothetical protein
MKIKDGVVKGRNFNHHNQRNSWCSRGNQGCEQYWHGN